MQSDNVVLLKTYYFPIVWLTNQTNENMSADPEYQKLQKQLKDVAIEGTIEDEIRPIFSE